MKDYLSIGSSPAGESCAQVGSENYAQNARKECKAYINQLRRQFGPEPGSAQLYIKANPHDFGTYYEVNCRFDDQDEEGMNYALKCESEAWEQWDEIAKQELQSSTSNIPSFTFGGVLNHKARQ